MFSDVYNKGQSSDSDKEQSMLSIYNQTGYQIFLHDFIGVEVCFYIFTFILNQFLFLFFF